MTTETILTDERIFALAAEADIASIDPKVDVLMFSWDEMLQAGRAIEQAVLQSPEIRALRKDAERYRFMRSVENGAVLEAAIDAAMEKQP